MGIQQEDIDAEEVIIKCSDKTIIIKNPSVQKVNMMGQKNYQISGEEHIESIDSAPEISEDDIKQSWIKQIHQRMKQNKH